MLKKIVIVSLVITLFSPPTANAFFNNDCKNLVKRTSVNQKKYEKAWNRYQKTLAEWVNAVGNDFGRAASTAGPVSNLFRQVGQKQIVIIQDYVKYPKCVNNISGGWKSFGSKVTQITSSANYISFMFNEYFQSVMDYKRYLK